MKYLPVMIGSPSVNFVQPTYLSCLGGVRESFAISLHPLAIADFLQRNSLRIHRDDEIDLDKCKAIILHHYSPETRIVSTSKWLLIHEDYIRYYLSNRRYRKSKKTHRLNLFNHEIQESSALIKKIIADLQGMNSESAGNYLEEHASFLHATLGVYTTLLSQKDEFLAAFGYLNSIVKDVELVDEVSL